MSDMDVDNNNNNNHVIINNATVSNSNTDNNNYNNDNNNNDNNNNANYTQIKVYPEIINNGRLKFQLKTDSPKNITSYCEDKEHKYFILNRPNDKIEDSRSSFFVNWLDNKTEKGRNKTIEYRIVIQIGNEDPQKFGIIKLWFKSSYESNVESIKTNNKVLNPLKLEFNDFTVMLTKHKENKIFKGLKHTSNTHSITIKLKRQRKQELFKKGIRQKKRQRDQQQDENGKVVGKQAEIGTAPTGNLVSENDLTHINPGEFNEVKANHGEFGTLKARQLKVTSDPNFKLIMETCPNDILKSVTENLELYIYEWRDEYGNLTGDMDAGPMADQLWELGQKIGIPLVTFHDGSPVNSEEEMKNRIQNGKHLIVCNNALNTLNLQCIKELKKQQDIFQEFTEEQKKYVEQFSIKCKSINETIQTLMNQVEKNRIDIENNKARLKALEDTNKKKQYNPFHIIPYKNTKGIIFVCINYPENIEEANAIGKITNAKIFKGTLDAFREELSKEKYTFVHFIGHGQITIDTTKLELTFTDTTSTPPIIQCIKFEVFLKLLIQNDITLFTMSACETSPVVKLFIENGGLYAYGYKKKVASVAAPILSEEFYEQLFKMNKTPEKAFECGKTAILTKIKDNPKWVLDEMHVHEQKFDLLKENEGGDPIFKENDEKIKEIYTERVNELCLLRASKDGIPFLTLFYKFIEKPENFVKVVAALNKNDGKEIDRIKQEMELEELLVKNISVENVSSEMLQEICKKKILAQDDLTTEQEEKYNEYEKYNANEERKIGCVHIKGFAGTGKTFLGLHFICKMLIDNSKANILFACTQNGFAYFFARWILIRMLSRKGKYGDDETKGEENDNNYDPESILNRIHFCTRKTNGKPHKAILQLNEQGNAYLKFVPIDETINNYDLVVIDEAHHIVRKNDKVWKKILRHFEDAKQRVILSDDNQGPSAIQEINNAIKYALESDVEVFSIELRDVVRSTQAITLLSHLFRKNEEQPSCKNQKFGIPIEPFLIVDSNKDDNGGNIDNNIITQHVTKTIDALKHTKNIFAMEDGKDLGWFRLSRGRVVIILPDDHDSLTLDAFTNTLQAEIGKKNLEINVEFFNGETMFGMFPQLNHTSVQIVVDTISNQDGLEYDAAIVVGFDETIDDNIEESELDRKKASVYRAITRAKLFVGIVDKPVQYGLYHSIWTDTELDKIQITDSERNKLYEKQSKSITKIETITPNNNLKEGPKDDYMDVDTDNTQPEPKRRKLNEEHTASDVKTSTEVSEAGTIDNKIKQTFINTNNIHEKTKSELGQPKQSLFKGLEDINIELNDANDYEDVDDNINTTNTNNNNSKNNKVDKKKSAAYIKWEKEFDGKTKVDSGWKNITDEDALAIGELLKTNKTLTELWLHDAYNNNYNGSTLGQRKNNITDVQSIGEGLKTNKTLKSLKLDSNNITDVQSIGEGLKTNKTLKSLRLQNNNITDVQSIGEGLKANKTLTELNLNNNNIRVIQSIGDGLKTNKTLTELYLNNNNITDVQSIGEGLITNNTLKELYLRNNYITDVHSIGEGLKTNNTLKELRLQNNNITDVQSIGEGLKTNNTLTGLGLYNNKITDVQSIGEGLKTNKTLTYLHLHNNNITDDSGIQSIIDGLKTNNTLRYLDLYNNQLSDNMKSQLKAIQQYKRDGSNGYQQVKGMNIYA